MSNVHPDQGDHPFLGFGPGGLTLSTTLAPAEHPNAQAFLAYCERQRGSAAMLHRTAIDPRHIVALMPDLFIAEPDGDDWRYRLAGGNVQARAGVEFTGKPLRRICSPESAAAAKRLYDSVVRRREPACVRNDYRSLGVTTVVFEAVQVPMLARDGITIHVFGGMFFF